MNKRFKKLLIQEVALAGNPINKEEFLIIKDGGLKKMNDKIKLAAFLLKDEGDIQEIVKEELKGSIPKEGETLKIEGIEVKIGKDGLSVPEYEEVKKELEKSKAELKELKKDGKEDILKDVPKEVKERLEKLEKEAKEANEKAEKIRVESIKKDFESRVGEEIAKDLMEVYDIEKEEGLRKVVEKIEGLKKMVKDLSGEHGRTAGEDKEQIIKDGIKKLMEKENLGLNEATVKFYKENPNLV